MNSFLDNVKGFFGKVKKFFSELNEKINPRFRGEDFKIFKRAYWWYIAPLAILFVSLLCGTIYAASSRYDGFANVGVDFRGGTVLSVEMLGQDMTGSNYRNNLTMIEDIVKSHGATPVSPRTNGQNAIEVRYANSINGTSYNNDAETMAQINDKIKADIEAKFKSVYGTTTAVSADVESITATASSQALRSAFLAVFVALLLMLVYIVVRFDLFSGIATIAALMHDVIIMMALVIIFRIQINTSLIAGIITVIAYSINSNIILFDKVRENIKPFKTQKTKYDVGLIVDQSVTQTFTRMVFTSFTTLIMLFVLAVVGIAQLTEFALPIIFGLLAGFYSSIGIAPGLWGILINANRKYKAKKMLQPSSDDKAKNKKTAKA
ncbi:MAG: protein translocase subunit SecF [Firmicutes bacterium]|nr:protein translocase subunit SecF [Bacillota bacterium]